MVVFDATMILLAMRPDVAPPIDEATGKPVEYVKERIDALIKRLDKEKVKIIVPSPALSEMLVRAGDETASLINTIQKSSVFSIEDFDTLAAIEVAMMTQQAKKDGNKRGDSDNIWAKVKYDRQIVSIAKVHRATAIYSDDSDLRSLGKTFKIDVIRLADLPVPTDSTQGVLPLETKVEEIINNDEQEVFENERKQKEENKAKDRKVGFPNGILKRRLDF
jgi:hypothetical protein